MIEEHSKKKVEENKDEKPDGKIVKPTKYEKPQSGPDFFSKITKFFKNAFDL